MSINLYYAPFIIMPPKEVTAIEAIISTVLFVVIIGLCIYLFKKQKNEHHNKKS